ncbi:MAG: nicotinamide riboside transporter PnuC [Oscillospiraceae bacterium]|nr:nicotinamide riboside transporter PnuC [Oscillospiraceae bacterium]
MKNRICYFTRTEKLLWSVSAALIVSAFLIFDRVNLLTLAASLVGVTSLIFCAKGNPIGQALMIVFSVLYGIISLTFSYYGEMITYLGMTMPMAIMSLISWLRNPYGSGKSEVRVNRISRRELVFALLLTAVVTVIFYFILKAFNTANLIPSTISVTTSFFAAYLTCRRSPWFAAAYATNDLVLIVLWTLAAFSDVSYLSVTVCFAAFFVNDLYGFVNWRRMARRQSAE